MRLTSSRTWGFVVSRSGWKSRKRWKYQARASRVYVHVDFWTPGMPVGRVIDDQVHEDADPCTVGRLHELREVAARAEARVDAVVVGDVVAVVAVRGRLARRQPHRVDPERRQVVEPLRQAHEVA